MTRMNILRRPALGALALLFVIGLLAWAAHSVSAGRDLPSAPGRLSARAQGARIYPAAVVLPGPDTPKADPLERDPIDEAQSDPFRIVSFLPEPPKIAAPPPPPPPPVPVAVAPAAPPFPYHYFGRMVDVSGKSVTYLTRENAMISIYEGLILDSVYRIDAVTEGRILITYLPLGDKLEIAAVSAAH